MFFKRLLVVVVGVLLFIGGFLWRYHQIDAQINQGFEQARVQYGVQDTVLTAHQEPVHPPAPPTAAPAVVPASTASIAPAAAAPAATTPETVPAVPGSAPDTNTIIGPLPPPGTATPESTPSPSAPIAPMPSGESNSPDTNSGAMMPSVTRVDPRSGPASPFLVLAAYDPAEAAMTLGGDATAQAAPAPSMKAPATNAATTSSPASVTTNVAGPVTPAASAPVPATPPGGPPRPLPVEASVIVLGYHQFSGPGVPSKNIYSMSQDVFSSEMKYLHDNGYHVVPLSDVVRFIKHEIGLPPNSVAITIDDGYKSAINYAAPVLKQYGYPWTYFVYPEFITRTEGKGAASWPDLVSLQAQGVDIECHSMTHPILPSHRQKFKGPKRTLTPEEYSEFLVNETAGAKAILEHELGRPVPYFAYPYGEYNQTVEAAVIAAGFEAIFTVADNPVHSTTDIHSIGRYIITKPVERLFASYLRQGALSIAEADPAPGATISNPRPVITAVLGFTGTLDPNSLETDVRDYGIVRHDFDPKTSTIRLYLPRDLIQSEVRVNIHVRDAQSGQMMVANWHFNYEPATAVAPVHQPISSAPVTNAAPKPAPAAVISGAPASPAPSLPSAPTKTSSTP
jgi:peptidoglycan/xylan/chitin deacetylase (PgdA/CDA1 family)